MAVSPRSPGRTTLTRCNASFLPRKGPRATVTGLSVLFTVMVYACFRGIRHRHYAEWYAGPSLRMDGRPPVVCRMDTVPVPVPVLFYFPFPLPFPFLRGSAFLPSVPQPQRWPFFSGLRAPHA